MEKDNMLKFVDAILNKKHVKALKILENAMKEKVAKRIANTLKE